MSDARFLCVLQPGASVTVGDNIPAKVLAVRIGRNYLVQYEVVLWDKAVRLAEQMVRDAFRRLRDRK